MIEKRGGGTRHAAATRTAWWHVVHGEEHHESASDATAGRKWPLWIRSLDVDEYVYRVFTGINQTIDDFLRTLSG